MKTFITFTVLMSLTLSYVALGQPYKDGVEYQTSKNAYRCQYSVSQYDGNHYYGFTNTKNVLRSMHPGHDGWGDTPKIISERRLLNLLYEVYGGKEKMQIMGKETIDMLFYIGMDFRVKELVISISSDKENICTSIIQVEDIENLIKENIRFIFDRNDPTYRNAIYVIQAGFSYVISEIPEILEKGEYLTPHFRTRRRID